MESLSVSLQNLVNAMYSRDISKKVSTALRAQMETGGQRPGPQTISPMYARFCRMPRMVEGHQPSPWMLSYGYLWNEDKTAYVVDEEAAAVVRQIFEWKRQEVSVYIIVERLKNLPFHRLKIRDRNDGRMGVRDYDPLVHFGDTLFQPLVERRRGVYDCSTHVRRGHATCFNHFIRQDALNEKVFNAIRALVHFGDTLFQPLVERRLGLPADHLPDVRPVLQDAPDGGGTPALALDGSISSLSG